jgi:hypothetical protein
MRELHLMTSRPTHVAVPGRTTRAKLHRGRDSQCHNCNQHCCRCNTFLVLSHRALLLLQHAIYPGCIGPTSVQATEWHSNHLCIKRAVFCAVAQDVGLLSLLQPWLACQELHLPAGRLSDSWR